MRHFVNKFSGLFLIFTILEQLIVATSTYAMIALSSEILKGEGMIWFWVFVRSLVLVFVPRIFSQNYMVKAEYATFQRYLALYESNLYNRPSLKTSHAFGGERQSYFQNQTWQTIEKTYEFFEDLMATVLNVVFNVLVIGWSLSPWFFAAYLCATVVIVAGILAAKGKIARKSAGAQEAQSAVQNRLFDGWDTLLIGNRYNWNSGKRCLGTDRWGNLRFSSGDGELRFKNVENFLEFLLDCAEEGKYGRMWRKCSTGWKIRL